MEPEINNPARPGEGERILATDGAGAALSAAAAAAPRPIDWIGLLRCFFLSLIVILVLILAWRPGVFRLSVLFSFGMPSLADRLAWQPESLAVPPPPTRKAAFSPAEWRLVSNSSPSWIPAPAPMAWEWFRFNSSLPPPVWRRHSHNPWLWRDDREEGRKRDRETFAGSPFQKPVTPFRAGDLAAWPEVSLAPADHPPTENAGEEVGFPALMPFPSILPEPNGQRAAGQLPGAAAVSRPSSGTGASSLPPAPPPPSIRAAVAPPAAIARPDAVPVRAPAGSAPDNGQDWRNREIAGPLPGAYLTIYPKLKFIGLCLPGQGYIRKYNQVGVPSDLVNPKMEAQDGRTPYGSYYIADRHRDADGPRLFLSWPSPEDARRLGIDPGRIAQVDNAWRRHELPPQDTVAGGGVGLNGLRNWVEVTEGGFSLEAPHMEEIFTALPDGAWIFIQP